jgi:uncharacterized delta-60 repeat protein
VSRDPAYYGPFPFRLVVLPDGRLLVATQGAAAAKLQTNAIVLTRLLPGGGVDASFGSSGSLVTGLQVNGDIAVQRDGRILVAGSTGTSGPPSTRAAAVSRLNADGSPDSSFGTGGTATVPGENAVATALRPDGSIAVLATGPGQTSRVALLSATGGSVPSWGGGAPVSFPLPGPGGLLARADGTLDVLTYAYDANIAARLQRLRADGTPDPGFGSGGTLEVASGAFGARLVPGPEGGTVVAGSQPGPTSNLFNRLTVTRVGPTGIPASGAFEPGFGGGYGTFRAVIRLPIVGTVRQNGFTGGTVRMRPDGGLIVGGSAAVIQYTGEGEGYLHEEVAVAAYRPDLTPDPAFGAIARDPARLRLSVPPQRLATIATRRAGRAIRVLANTSGPGLADVRVSARGRLVAHTIAPVMRAGSGQRLSVYFTKAGRALLRAGRGPVRVTVTATFRNLVRADATASATGVLR